MVKGFWRIFPRYQSCRSGGAGELNGPVLRDTARLSQRYPPIARYGVFGVSTWPIGCDTPSPFSERFPLGEHAKWRCDTPPLKRGISAILARYPMKTRQMGAIPPLRYYLERVLRDMGGGGISHWAAKPSLACSEVQMKGSKRQAPEVQAFLH